MRDIGSRIGRYRLTRYARRRGVRGVTWILVGLGLWLLWAVAISDHSLLRIWRLRRERSTAQHDLADVRREHARIEAELERPGARRKLAERRLREESGMARPGEIVYRIRGDAADTTRRR